MISYIKNVNINGNNTGDINVGNNGQVAPPLPAARGEYLNDDMYSGEEYSGYNNGHIKKDKSFECIINNNNNNTVVGGEEPTVLPIPVEICGNGIDDDLDGQVDEGCPPPDNDLQLEITNVVCNDNTVSVQLTLSGVEHGSERLTYLIAWSKIGGNLINSHDLVVQATDPNPATIFIGLSQQNVEPGEYIIHAIVRGEVVYDTFIAPDCPDEEA